MAHIQTTIRLIKVKETYDEVIRAMEFHWMQLIEDISYHGEYSDIMHEHERRITLNRDYIIEVYD